MALYGSSKRPLIVLQKKEPAVKLSELNGKWMISQAGGEAIPSGMEKQPFIEFNISEKRLMVMPVVILLMVVSGGQSESYVYQLSASDQYNDGLS